MRLKIEVMGRDDQANVPESERKSVSVETHVKRGDTFTIQKVDNVMEGSDAVMFTAPSAGRIVINMPDTNEEMIYDRDQAAAVRASQQQNVEGRADRATTAAPPPQNMAPPPPPTPLVQGTDPRTQPRPGAPATPAPPPADLPTTGGRRSNPTEDAKAAQTSAAGRPAGETPPKSGSPVGSPPEGNEGVGQKG